MPYPRQGQGKKTDNVEVEEIHRRRALLGPNSLEARGVRFRGSHHPKSDEYIGARSPDTLGGITSLVRVCEKDRAARGPMTRHPAILYARVGMLLQQEACYDRGRTLFFALRGNHFPIDDVPQLMNYPTSSMTLKQSDNTCDRPRLNTYFPPKTRFWGDMRSYTIIESI